MIDEGAASSTFTATPNLIDSTGEIAVLPPLNNNEDSSYTVIFESPSFIPQNGFIKVVFPD